MDPRLTIAALFSDPQSTSGSQATFQRLQNETAVAISKLQGDAKAKKSQVRTVVAELSCGERAGAIGTRWAGRWACAIIADRSYSPSCWR